MINLDLLNAYRPSLVRAYIPRAAFPCAVAQRLHYRLRDTFRALQSYRVPDTQHGPRYIELPTLQKRLVNNTRLIDKLVAHDYQHRPDLPPCECCEAVITTTFHRDAIAVAVELLEEIQKDEAQKIDVNAEEVTNA